MIELGRYRLTSPIGRGRITESFRAKSFGVEGFEKTLVVKRFLPKVVGDPAALAEVLVRARLSMRLSHANVAQVLEVGEATSATGTVYFVATEFVPGMSLKALFDALRTKDAWLSENVLLFIATEVLKALDHAHRAKDEHQESLGIVHGSLSPANVLISWEGEIKVSDFGLVSALNAQARPAPLEDLKTLFALLEELLPTEEANGDESPASVSRDTAGLIKRVGQRLFEALEPTGPRAQGEEGFSAAQLYETLMEHAYRVRAKPGAEELSELLEKNRTGPETHPPALFEGALEQRVESLIPRSPEPAPSEAPATQTASPGEASVAVTLRFGEASLPESSRLEVLGYIERFEGRIASSTTREIEAYWSAGELARQTTQLGARVMLELLARFSRLDPGMCAGLDLGPMHYDAQGRMVDDENRRVLFSSTRALAAFPAKVVISQACGRYLETWFEVEPIEPGSELLMLGAMRPLHTGSRFVGRKSELSDLGNRLVLAVRGSALPVGIVSDGGMGKSRLLREMRRRLKRGTVSVGFYLVNCRAASRNEPYSAISDMLRKLCGVRENEPGEWAPQVQPRLRALGLGEEEIQCMLMVLGSKSAATSFNSVFLKAAVAKSFQSLSLERPHLFAFDRAEYLDGHSAELLANVGARLRHSRTLLVFAGRAGHVGFLRQIPGYSEFALTPLSPDDIERLVATGTGVASPPADLLEYITRQSKGHPMVALELLREGIEQGFVQGVKDGVKFSPPYDLVQEAEPFAVLERRVGSLSQEERRVLSSVVVLDEPVELNFVAFLAGRSLAETLVIVDDLEVRGLLQRLSPATLGISGQIVGEAVLRVEDPLTLRTLHDRAAAHYLLQSSESGPETLIKVAHHAEAAGDRERARTTRGAVGLALVAQGFLERGAIHLGRALALTSDDANLDQVADWVSALGRTRSQANVAELAPILASASRLLATSSSEDGGRLGAAIDGALLLIDWHHFKEAERVLEEALSRTASRPALTRRGLLANAAMFVGRGEYPTAVRNLERASGLGALGPHDQHRLLLTLAQALSGAGEASKAARTLAQAEELGSKLGPLESSQRVRMRAFLLSCQGDHAASAQVAGRAFEVARNLGLTSEAVEALHEESVNWVLAGEHPKGYAAAQRALDAASQIGSERLLNSARMCLAYLDGLQNTPDSGDALLASVQRAQAEGWSDDVIFGRYLLGKLLLAREQLEAGSGELKLALELAKASGNQRWVRLAGHALALA